ncbi:MAG: hypothetical protein KAG53_03130 [Endozoicomonadaceae bacterium]|nr:hypothetical protein [Endozoicomonadaceae bacterium]
MIITKTPRPFLATQGTDKTTPTPTAPHVAVSLSDAAPHLQPPLPHLQEHTSTTLTALVLLNNQQL